MKGTEITIKLKSTESEQVLHHSYKPMGCLLKQHYLHRSCCQRPGGGRGDTDSAPLPLSPSGIQTGSAGRNMRLLLEDRQGNTGWGSVREMGHWITAETTHTQTHTYTHTVMPPHTRHTTTVSAKLGLFKQNWWPNGILKTKTTFELFMISLIMIWAHEGV